MKLSKLTAVLCCAVALWAAVPAHASIELAFQSVQPDSGLTASLRYNGSSVNARIGQMFFSARNQDLLSPQIPLIDGPDSDSDQDDLLTFCIELGQYVSSQWNTYSKTPLADAPNPDISGSPGGYVIGDFRAAALDLLADNFWDDATGSNKVLAVAFQLSVWEIVHESVSGSLSDPPLAGTLNVDGAVGDPTRGTFYVSSPPSTGLLRDAINQANSWLAMISAGSLQHEDSLSLIALTNPLKQDQIVQYSQPSNQTFPDAPEPMSLLVWGGLFGVCLTANSRSRR